MNDQKMGALMVALSAACFAFMPLFTKLAYAGSVNMATALAGRFALAALIIWALILFTGQSPVVSRLELKSFFFLGFWGYAVASTCLFAAIIYIPASLASMLLYIHPILVALVELFLYRLPLTRNKLAALLLSIAGLILILGTTMRSVNIIGVLLGLGAAFGYTIYLVYGNRAVQSRTPIITTGYVILMAAIGFNLFALTTGQLDFDFAATGWFWIGGLAVISTCMAIMLLFAGLKRIEASRVAIISTFEPVLTVILSALILSERISGMQVVGGLMVLVAIIVLQLNASSVVVDPNGSVTLKEQS